MENCDVVVENHGSIVLLRPNTPEASAWIDENCATESWQFLGTALAVEPRCVEPIVEGLQAEGFTVGGAGWL